MMNNEGIAQMKMLENKNLIKKIKFFFTQDYFRNPLNIWLIIFNFVINSANWAILLIFVEPVDFSIILHYNVYFGVDVIGDWRKIFLLPALGIFLFFLNLSLAIYFYKQEEKTASYILMLVSVLIQINLMIASTTLTLINY
jgi:hypothetical protein